MSYYTVKYIKEFLADLPDDEPVAGFLMLRNESEFVTEDEAREVTPDEWEEVVDEWEQWAGHNNSVFDSMRDGLFDAINSVCEEEVE